MKRIVFVVLVAAELFVLLCACSGAQEAPAPPAAEPPASSAEEMPSAAICMGSIRHPIHRVVQLGFMEAADELGYEGHILGLAESGMQELLDCWLQGAREYDIAGAVCWVGDDSAYEFLKELHGMGVKTVVPHFPFSYEDAKEFVDVNVHADKSAMVEHAAEFICLKLRENNINSGVIGVSAGMHDDTDLLFKQYIMSHYPEYTVAETIMLGAEKLEARKKATENLQKYPDMVAVFGTTDNSAPAWVAAKKATGRSDLIVVGFGQWTSLQLLADGDIDAFMTQPWYEDGYTGLTLLDTLLCGEIYNTSEELWRKPILQNALVYQGGTGTANPEYYNDQFCRAKARFVFSGS